MTPLYPWIIHLSSERILSAINGHQHRDAKPVTYQNSGIILKRGRKIVRARGRGMTVMKGPFQTQWGSCTHDLRVVVTACLRWCKGKPGNT